MLKFYIKANFLSTRTFSSMYSVKNKSKSFSRYFFYKINIKTINLKLNDELINNENKNLMYKKNQSSYITKLLEFQKLENIKDTQSINILNLLSNLDVQSKIEFFKNSTIIDLKQIIVGKLVEDLSNLIENNLTLENLKNIKEIFSFLNNKSELIKRKKINIEMIIISLNNNFEKYKLLHFQDENSFFNIFSQVVLIDKKTRSDDSFENLIHLFDKLSEFLIEDLEKINFNNIGNLLNDINRSFYKNDRLNEKIIDLINSNCQMKKFPINSTYKQFKIFITPIIYSRILEKIEKEKSKKFLENFIETQIHIIKTQKIPLLDLCQNFKSFTLIHSILLNEFKIPKDDLTIKRLNGILNFYINSLYDRINEVQNMLFAKIIFRSFIYLKSLNSNFKKVKINEMIDLLMSIESFKEFLIQSQSSDYHKDFMKYLKKLEIEYESEDMQNYLSKDIILKNQKVCFELDGLHHFFYDYEYNYQTVFKKNILQNFRWRVINVKYNEWQVLKSEEKIDFIRNELNLV